MIPHGDIDAKIAQERKDSVAPGVAHLWGHIDTQTPYIIGANGMHMLDEHAQNPDNDICQHAVATIRHAQRFAHENACPSQLGGFQPDTEEAKELGVGAPGFAANLSK